MALLNVTAGAEDLGYLSDKEKNTGDLKFYVYVSVIDNNGQPLTGLTKKNFGLVMFDGLSTITLKDEWEMKHFDGEHLNTIAGFYGLTLDRKLKNEYELPEARLFGLTVKHGSDFGQTIFKLSYLKQ